MVDEDRISKVLLKALKTLPERERDEVLSWLIGRTHVPFTLEPDVTVRPGPPFDVSKQTSQPFVVRLPLDLHERLRAWSTSHRFSMAAVTRGLIERFLDQQEELGK
jgi:hypothetical protein